MYSVSDRHSFHEAQELLGQLAKLKLPSYYTSLLLGNKRDLDHSRYVRSTLVSAAARDFRIHPVPALVWQFCRCRPNAPERLRCARDFANQLVRYIGPVDRSSCFSRSLIGMETTELVQRCGSDALKRATFNVNRRSFLKRFLANPSAVFRNFALITRSISLYIANWFTLGPCEHSFTFPSKDQRAKAPFSLSVFYYGHSSFVFVDGGERKA